MADTRRLKQKLGPGKAGIWSGTFEEPAEWRRSKRVGEISDIPHSRGGAPVGLMAAGATVKLKDIPTTSARSCKTVKSCHDAVILWCGGYIRAGDTPDKNAASKIVLQWVDEFIELLTKAGAKGLDGSAR